MGLTRWGLSYLILRLVCTWLQETVEQNNLNGWKCQALAAAEGTAEKVTAFGACLCPGCWCELHMLGITRGSHLCGSGFAQLWASHCLWHRRLYTGPGSSFLLTLVPAWLWEHRLGVNPPLQRPRSYLSLLASHLGHQARPPSPEASVVSICKVLMMLTLASQGVWDSQEMIECESAAISDQML